MTLRERMRRACMYCGRVTDDGAHIYWCARSAAARKLAKKRGKA